MICTRKIGVTGFLARAAIGIAGLILLTPVAIADSLTEHEEQVLATLSTQRTLERMRDISNIVQNESGAGSGSVISGSEEEKVLAAYLADEFSALGIEVRQESFPVREFNYGPLRWRQVD